MVLQFLLCDFLFLFFLFSWWCVALKCYRRQHTHARGYRVAPTGRDRAFQLVGCEAVAVPSTRTLAFERKGFRRNGGAIFNLPWKGSIVSKGKKKKKEKKKKKKKKKKKRERENEREREREREITSCPFTSTVPGGTLTLANAVPGGTLPATAALPGWRLGRCPPLLRRRLQASPSCAWRART